MRLPFEPGNPAEPKSSVETNGEAAAAPSTTDKRDPSYPDRARIDSDVRAFLRPVSSPWIVFDRDSRAEGDFGKSALRIGAVFASSPSLLPEPRELAEAMATGSSKFTIAEPVITQQDQPLSFESPARMFPAPVINEAPVVEPSNVVVAKDVLLDEQQQPRAAIESDPFAVPGLVPNRKKSLMIAGGVVGMLALAAVVALSIGGRHATKAKAPVANAAIVQQPAAAPPPVVAIPAAVPEPAAAIEIDQAPTPAAAPSPADHKDEGENSKDPKKRFGKLTIKADAAKAGKMVWFDGKRMIGVGQRSYLVFCGMHTVAVADKTDTKDVEIPCNGEFTVAK